MKLNEFIDTSRYVYNKTLEFIKNGHRPNFQDLRDKIVTDSCYGEYKNSQQEIKVLQKIKSETENNGEKEKIDLEIKAKYKKLRQDMKLFKPVKNDEIKDFELSTPKVL